MNTEEVKQHVEDIEKLRRQTRRLRSLTLVALIAIVVAGVSAMISSVYALALAGPKQNEFISHLAANAQRDVVPVVQKIAGRSLNRLKPALEKEWQTLNARALEVSDAAVKELHALRRELPVHGEKILDQTVGATLKQREDKLRSMYPGLYDRQIPVLLDNLSREVQDQVARTSEKIFNPHLDSIQSILADLEKVQKTEPIDPKKEIDPWQTAFLFVDVFVHEFNDLAVVSPAATKETQP
jgi:hypothetical protein